MHLTFLTLYKINSGYGAEKVLFNLLKYKPKNISVRIVQTNLSGVELLSDQEVEKLTNNAEIITIYTSKKNNKVKKRDRYKRDYLTNVKENIIPFLIDWGNLKRFDHDLLEKINRTDIVYVLCGNRFLLFNRQTPIIWSNHCNNLEQYDRDGIAKIYYLVMLSIIKLIYRNNGIHVFPKNRDKIGKLKFKYEMVLSNGVDSNLFYPDHNVQKIPVKFFFIGHLRSNKGVDILLDAFNRLDGATEVELHIAGKGPLENVILSNKRIIYHGKVSDSELPELFRSMDVFVYPSHSDTFGLVVLEALSSGLYVLAGEYLKGNFDDFEGKYLEYINMNADSFLKRMDEIAKNPGIISHDKVEQHCYIRENYDWNKISEKFYSHMRSFYGNSIKK